MALVFLSTFSFKQNKRFGINKKFNCKKEKNHIKFLESIIRVFYEGKADLGIFVKISAIFVLLDMLTLSPSTTECALLSRCEFDHLAEGKHFSHFCSFWSLSSQI